MHRPLGRATLGAYFSGRSTELTALPRTFRPRSLARLGAGLRCFARLALACEQLCIRFGFFVFGTFWVGAKCAKHHVSSPSQKSFTFSAANLSRAQSREKFLKGV